MKNGQIYRRALKLAVPMMIQNGITNMVGLIDNVMVGSLGTEAMTAVSIVSQLMFVFNLAIFGGLSGPGIFSAQYYGQGNTEGVRNAFRLKLWIGVFCSILGFIVFIFAGETLILRYLRGESEQMDALLTLNNAKGYLKIMLASIVPFVITQVYASSLRETGDSIKPMVAGVLSVLFDIVFNYIFIFGKFGMPKLGVNGAAYATVLARVVEMLVVIIWAQAARQKHEFLKGIYKTLKVPAEVAVAIIKKGLPIFFNEFLWAGAIAMLTQSYAVRGLEIVAGLNISNAICNLMNVAFVALGSAVGILIGQTLGAKEFERAKKEAFSLMWFAAFLCLGLAVILILLSGVFPRVYNTSDIVREYGSKFIFITALFFPLQGFLNALYFTLRSGGKTFITFLFDSVFTWAVPVLSAYILCNYTGISIFAIYFIVQLADILKVSIGLVLIRKGVWISNIVDDI